MNLTIKSKRLGKDVTFSRPGSGYIYVDTNGKPGSLGKQICKGGGFLGSTIRYIGDSQKEFEKVCRKWWRAYLLDTRDDLVGCGECGTVFRSDSPLAPRFDGDRCQGCEEG